MGKKSAKMPKLNLAGISGPGIEPPPYDYEELQKDKGFFEEDLQFLLEDDDFVEELNCKTASLSMKRADEILERFDAFDKRRINSSKARPLDIIHDLEINFSTDDEDDYQVVSVGNMVNVSDKIKITADDLAANSTKSTVIPENVKNAKCIDKEYNYTEPGFDEKALTRRFRGILRQLRGEGVEVTSFEELRLKAFEFGLIDNPKVKVFLPPAGPKNSKVKKTKSSGSVTPKSDQENVGEKSKGSDKVEASEKGKLLGLKEVSPNKPKVLKMENSKESLSRDLSDTNKPNKLEGSADLAESKRSKKPKKRADKPRKAKVFENLKSLYPSGQMEGLESSNHLYIPKGPKARDSSSKESSELNNADKLEIPKGPKAKDSSLKESSGLKNADKLEIPREPRKMRITPSKGTGKENKKTNPRKKKPRPQKIQTREEADAAILEFAPL